MRKIGTKSKIGTLFGAIAWTVALSTVMGPTAAHATYVAPETVLARVYGPSLINGSIYASCRLDAGYGKTLFYLRCGVKRLDEHWYGDSEHEMWQTTVYAVAPHQQIMLASHDGFRCRHGKKYSVWTYGQSTGFVNTSDSSAHTRFRTFC